MREKMYPSKSFGRTSGLVARRRLNTDAELTIEDKPPSFAVRRHMSAIRSHSSL
jgi:hypothetical protein